MSEQLPDGLRRLLGEMSQGEPEPENSQMPRATITGQVHDLLEKAQVLRQYDHGLRSGDFVMLRPGFAYAKWPTERAPGLILEVASVENARMPTEEAMSSGCAHVREDCLVILALRDRLAGYWLDGRLLMLHEQAMREAYGPDWRATR